MAAAGSSTAASRPRPGRCSRISRRSWPRRSARSPTWSMHLLDRRRARLRPLQRGLCRALADRSAGALDDGWPAGARRQAGGRGDRLQAAVAPLAAGRRGGRAVVRNGHPRAPPARHVTGRRWLRGERLRGLAPVGAASGPRPQPRTGSSRATPKPCAAGAGEAIASGGGPGQGPRARHVAAGDRGGHAPGRRHGQDPLRCRPLSGDLEHAGRAHAVGLGQMPEMLQHPLQESQAVVRVAAEIVRVPPQVVDRALLGGAGQAAGDSVQPQRLERAQAARARDAGSGSRGRRSGRRPAPAAAGSPRREIGR